MTEQAYSFSKDDMYFFNTGTHYRLYQKLGAHCVDFGNGKRGIIFRVWAPNAREVSVIGGFNYWSPGANSMYALGDSGVWETFIPDIGKGEHYKFHIISHADGYTVEKADPFAFRSELPPKTASIVWNSEYQWQDDQWMQTRHDKNSLKAPISIYEVHLGSWVHKGQGDSLSYRELAHRLVEYVKELGFTHVEFMPIMEYPYYGSWGYQITNYYSPTGRFGTPEDLMYLIDLLHQNSIGVIFDWVPSHFATDLHGLSFFDGTNLYEHSDPKKGYHPDWGSYIFNYGRHEVRSFLISNAFYWLDKFHVDGLRVDAVASMLYLDYSRKEGEWIPNVFGGRENLDAINFIKQFNEMVYSFYPGTQTIAEESTDWTGVSRPTYSGGLGFGFKWDMGWMHDTLEYMKKDPVHRKYHQNDITFRSIYAFSENFILPLSHDEVVHGKGSLLRKMPNDEWQKFANLRLLYGYMFATPGKKLLFMGDEFAQWDEWNHNQSLDWHLVQYDRHWQISNLLKDLNKLYKSESSLHSNDCYPAGFCWLDGSDSAQSVYGFLRVGDKPQDVVLVALNFTPVPRDNYRLGVPTGGRWREILNTDAKCYGGAGMGNQGSVIASNESWQGQSHSVNLTLPPLAMLLLKPE
jgi:1,4-alpha-glucan branching enzyme